MTSLLNILAPTDFSEAGNHALRVAIELCKKHKAVLHLLHVVEKRFIINEPDPELSIADLPVEINTASRSRLYHVYESILREHEISVQIHMPTGIPFDEICTAANEMPIDLVVMGTHGSSGVRQFFMGTTAYNVIRNTTRPVLTIPPNFDKSHFQHILLPVRAVPGTKEKFAYLQPLLASIENVTIHVAALCSMGEEELLLADRETLQHIIAYLRHHHIAHTKETHVCENLPDKVLALAEVHNADLIVINATLDYSLSQFFVGPYTQQIVNYAKVPVLSFRQAIDVPSAVKKAKEEALVRKIASA